MDEAWLMFEMHSWVDKYDELPGFFYLEKIYCLLVVYYSITLNAQVFISASFPN